MLNKDKSYKTHQFQYGVCYYPEHWERSLWDDDFRRMKELGFNVVRMGETAWNIFEPEEGRYSFDMFDEAIQLCAKHDLKVIMGTPTYAPPAWLTSAYPEVLRADFNGQLMQHGSRRHYNYTSPKYLDLCSKIVTEMAEHYGSNPYIIGWQIDNELNCHMSVSFAEADHIAFRQWCQERYVSLDTLNDAWGTAFWAQTYTDWQQVYLPRPTATYHNPGHLLDFYRFTSDSTIAFAELQSRILKDKAPGQFVTHNGLFSNIDNQKLTETALDFMSYDSYPSFALANTKEPSHFRDRWWSQSLGRVRGMSSKFLVLEQQSGPGGQSGSVLLGGMDYLQFTPKPGQMRLWTYQSIAHGADGILYFRWRTCPYGSETLWHGLNDYGNQPNRRLKEAEQIGREIRLAEEAILESCVDAQIAILSDYDNDSNNHIDRYIGNSQGSHVGAIFRGLTEKHWTVDSLSVRHLHTEESVQRYDVVFYPNAQLLEPKDVQQLQAYAEQGGTVVLGPRSGYKDRSNRAYMLPFPGIVRELCGLEVSEYTMVSSEKPSYVRFVDTGEKQSSERMEAPVFNEILKPEHPQAEVLATYTEDYYKDKPAIIRVPVGTGSVIYCGSLFTIELVQAIMQHVASAPKSKQRVTAPKELEIVSRRGHGGQPLDFILNYTSETQTLDIHETGTDRLSGQSFQGETTIAPYGVMLLQYK
ncbi:beta-galactosidase [Paenibacillus qinlingensis]|uniref:beta-galactosidase n=1 Tax=Paenibacillus qinlingensis TaxID=1837343 RepID=UPI00156661B2|nr:beta-galactosidase [Paenibacillus qinlingensis]NQX60101.1 beta-galactosidase [Paenibacillus qinlingensis]